jgi:nucleoside-diphosphate-sugar epimerase
VKALVTGAGGFLGRAVVRSLVGRGHDVRSVVRHLHQAEPLLSVLRSEAPGRHEVREASLDRPDACAGLSEGCDVVFHVAAGVSGSCSTLFLNSVVATRNLLESLDRRSVRRVVLVSSIAVYSVAASRKSVITEEAPLDDHPEDRDPYSYSKIAQESLARGICAGSGLACTVVRPGVIYGPGRDYLTNRVGLKFGATLFMVGGRQRLPYTFVTNCADAVARAGESEDQPGGAFNVIDDELPTGNELVRRYRRDVGPLRVVPIPLWSVPWLARFYAALHARTDGMIPPAFVPYRASALWNGIIFSAEKAKRVLGWRPGVGLAAALDATGASLRSAAALKGLA